MPNPNEDAKAQAVALLAEKLDVNDRMLLAKLISTIPVNQLPDLAVAIAESAPVGTEVPAIAGDAALARRYPHGARIGILDSAGSRRTL